MSSARPDRQTELKRIAEVVIRIPPKSGGDYSRLELAGKNILAYLDPRVWFAPLVSNRKQRK